MSDLWFPPATKALVVGHWSGGGPWAGGLPKIVHHITGGSTYAGAFGTYRHTGNLPHFTTSFEAGRFQVWQHLPLDTAASALKHDPPTLPQTNRARAIQIEHVAPTLTAAAVFPAGYLDGIAVLCRWIETAFGVDRRAPYPFVAPPRLTWDQWAVATGHLGHCHVPGNDHPDPGPIDIARILNAGAAPPAPTPPPQEDDMAVFQADDPHGGFWRCDETGAVWNFDNDGNPATPAAARMLGTLTGHADWNAGAGKTNGPVVAFHYWPAGDGYLMVTRDAGGSFHPYHFPGDGSLR